MQDAQACNPDLLPRILVLGTGGTIAGAPSAHPSGYDAGVLGIETLVDAVPQLQSIAHLTLRQLCSMDSKDMQPQIWTQLAVSVQQWRAEHPEHGGVVITHGSDTLEETAYVLQRLLPPGPPVVLTASMLPPAALSADGPRNFWQAVRLAANPEASGQGVLCALHDRVHGALDIVKAQPQGQDVFHSGLLGPLALFRGESLRWLRRQQPSPQLPLPQEWPRVEMVCSHAGADGEMVRVLLAASRSGALLPPLAGLIVLGTGGGTVHAELEQALVEARTAGVEVVIGSRLGALAAGAAADLSAPKLRLRLQLELAAQRRRQCDASCPGYNRLLRLEDLCVCSEKP